MKEFDVKKIRVVAMDLDGTLTQHKSPLTPENRAALDALDLYCKEKGLSHENVIYIGDDYGMGGNDESVYVSYFPYLTIDDYRTFPEVVAPLLK